MPCVWYSPGIAAFLETAGENLQVYPISEEKDWF